MASVRFFPRWENHLGRIILQLGSIAFEDFAGAFRFLRGHKQTDFPKHTDSDPQRSPARIGQNLGRDAFALQAPRHDMRFADVMRLKNDPPGMGMIVWVLCTMGKFTHGAQYIMVEKSCGEKKKLAATYSPTPLPVQYHRR